ncbi:MAG: aldolase/citrate lyase family protein [Symbiobacteriaceae bacterium]|nr:aldolase/citrate lyase family protein [Symbiobacteriaceae bacterium]
MVNRLKEKATRGEAALGAFIGISSIASVEILALGGLDFVIIDTEHGPFEVETALQLIMAAELRGLTPIVRARATERSALLKMLDAGGQGLLIPYLKSVAEAESIVSWGKYRPVGDRGYSFNRSGDYGLAQEAAGGIMEYFAQKNAATLLIPQCETAECLEQIESIVALPGIDGIFIGPFDLSISLGIAGQFDHPKLQEAFRRVLQACQAANKICLNLASTPEDALAKLAMGFHGVASTDIGFLKSGVSAFVQGIRKGV